MNAQQVNIGPYDEQPCVVRSDVGSTAVLRLNRPSSINALSARLISELDDHLADIETDSSRVVVLTGTGRAFCAGADLKELLGPGGDVDAAAMLAFERRGAAVFSRLAALPLPVIVAINGLTMAGGLELALHGDIIVADEDARIGDGHIGYRRVVQACDAADSRSIPADDDWYIVRHSGGTTGRAKGAGFTHYDWVKNGRNWAYLLDRMTADSVVGHAGPISHASGYLFLPIWLAGGANVLFGAFDPQRVLRMMRTHRVSHMFASPALLAALARRPESSSAPWPHLRSILVGGSPTTDATAQHAREVFGDTLYQAFGQTEAVPLTGMGPDEWFGDYPGSTPARSAGRVLPFAQVEIRDENDHPLPIGESGEIVAKVEGQMHGYWNEPELTATRLIDGWIHTRDIGRLDSNGFLHVLDRAEDMIVSGGFNIWPAELETVIADLPDVLEVAVFGIPHEKWGETPMAVVAVDAESTLSEQQVIDACRDRLGSYKKPTRVQVTTDPLPKSVVGKLLRRTLREPYWSGRDRHVQGV